MTSFRAFHFGTGNLPVSAFVMSERWGLNNADGTRLNQCDELHPPLSPIEMSLRARRDGGLVFPD
jgi:hypothetical protein